MRKFLGATAAALLVVLAVQYSRVAPRNRALDLNGLRIVSLAPNLTEILFELGAGNQVVGVTNYCTYPAEAQKKEKIGDFIHPNLEKIVSLKPGLVVAEQWTSTKVVSRLKGVGLHIVEVPSPKSVAEIYQVIRQVGIAVAKQDRAEALIEQMQERVRAIEERGKRFPRTPTLYVEIDLPSWTVGRDSFIHEAVHVCGAKNLFEDIESPALQASKEMVIERNPEIILSLEASAPEISRRPGWSQIGAVQTGKIIDDLDRNLLSHGNHRLVDGMEKLQARLSKLIEVRSK